MPRKSTDERVNTEVMHLRIPAVLLGRLRSLASAEDLETRDYIRDVLRQHVRSEEEREQANGRKAP